MTGASASHIKAARDVAVAVQGESSQPGETGHVVASGHGAVARQIIEIAAQHGIAIRQDADLAEVLAVLETDSPIPPEVMAIVAEILGYVYRANSEALAGQS
ncbi:MAG: EscU/YscU/HrcU family type III secretion system export apparatus switch protein [Alphaproteobacteria bacterium]